MASISYKPAGIANAARRNMSNKVTGENATWLKYSYETGGEKTVARIECLPGGGPPLHYHHTYIERFRPIEGTLGLTIGSEDVHLQPGQEAEVPIQSPHRFFNDSDKPIIMEVDVIPGQPGLEMGLSILFGLGNDGLLDETGVPKNPVHAAIVGSLSDMSLTGISGIVVNAMTIMLSAYGRWAGVEEELLKKYWY